MLLKHFIWNQIIRSKKQAVVFVLCVALSISSIFALDVFSNSVNQSLLRDARRLHAADIIIGSRTEISEAMTGRIHALEKRGLVQSARVYEFYSMAKAASSPDSILARLKIVSPAYPFYGQVALASGRSFQQVLAPGTAIAEQAFLDRLQLKTGDRIKVGNRLLTIVDVVVHEPDRPVTFYSLGPRVFIALEDLHALDLVKKGSRIRYRFLVKVSDPENLDRLFAELKASASGDERVATFRTARSRIKRFIDNFLFFLGLIGIFTLLLAGIGIQSTLTAFIRENEKSIAIMRTVGATSQFVSVHYLMIALLLGMVGGLIGMVWGFGIQKILLALFGSLLPQNISLTFTFGAIVKGVLLGLVVVSVFTLLPLYRIKAVKPNTIFRKERAHFKKGPPYYVSGIIILVFLMMMTLWILEDTVTGAYFVLGIAGLILITAILTNIALFAIKKVAVGHLALRQAFKGLFRPGNATQSIIVTLTASLAVVFTIYLIERNLDETFIQSYPEDAPNLYFLDIQPDQKNAFSQTLGEPAEYYPIVRARIVAVNEEKIDYDKERARKGDSLARVFNLTYRDYLLEDEVMHRGKGLFRDDFNGVQVSLLDTVQEIRPIHIGDRITFRIQGVPLQATVASIRTRTRESIRPFFYFVFHPDVLKDAPQTIFAALKVEKEKISPLQNRIVSRFPNISVIDITETASVFAKVLRKLSRIIRFFMSLSIVAGLLIIISSLLATRFARIREAVYFKILGARAAFVLEVLSLENLVIGIVSAVFALILSQTGSLIISKTILDINYKPFWGEGMMMAGTTVALVFIVGLMASIGILRKRPVVFLREQADE